MRLALRNRAFFIFSLFIPMLFLFMFVGLLARDAGAARYRLASVLALTVMGSFWGSACNWSRSANKASSAASVSLRSARARCSPPASCRTTS